MLNNLNRRNTDLAVLRVDLMTFGFQTYADPRLPQSLSTLAPCFEFPHPWKHSMFAKASEVEQQPSQCC